MNRTRIAALCLASLLCLTARADETCMSPYMAKIVGQEDFVYVWTLGVVGVGDEQDKLVTVDVNPKSPNYGKVVDSALGGRAQRSAPLRAHRRSPLPVGDRPRHQQDLHLRRAHRSGEAEAGAHHRRLRREERRRRRSAHAAMRCRAHAADGAVEQQGPRRRAPAMVEYTNDGEYVATHWMPTDDDAAGRRRRPATSPTATATTCARCRAATCSSRRRSPAGTTT